MSNTFTFKELLLESQRPVKFILSRSDNSKLKVNGSLRSITIDMLAGFFLSKGLASARKRRRPKLSVAVKNSGNFFTKIIFLPLE